MNEAGERYDIVIAGGGMIGTSVALALAPLGLRVAVVEAVERRAEQQPSFDDRSTALARSTQRMFEAMGLWNEIVAASTPIKRIHVSDKGRFGFSHIEADEQGVEALGYVVINRVLGAVLQTRLDTNAIDVICPARVADVAPGPARLSATLEQGERRRSLSCRLLIAADGANSGVREMLGIGVQRRDYAQRAIIGNLLPERPLEKRAFERFTPQGPLAILPIAGERAAFVWTVSESDADRILGLDDDAFLRAIQSEFGYRLGAFARVGKRVAYPLTLSKAVRLTAGRSVLVGNAAHGLHPVSAQGFNLGMRDVAALCDCISDVLSTSGDVGAADMLERYADWRRSDQRKLVHFTDNLVRMFGSPRRSTRIARNLGMLAFDLVPGVRSLFAKHTMGLAGELPRLSRGVPLR